jgi:LAO/AO transport system kinase
VLNNAAAFVEALRSGSVRALARGISMVEENAPGAVALLKEAFPHTGKATVIGVTGSPGAGKSSLVDRMVGSFRREGRRVGVVAVDPTSAYSGGAILGDRIRMQEHALDEGVFIRSMATRGCLGGLSRASADAVDLMDTAGYDPIIIETVGVGQDEIEIVRASDVVCVVLVPGMGDDIQAIKAGILEIADLFVVNKSDKPGADRLISDLDYMLSLASGPKSFRPDILKTVAVRDEGVKELCLGIQEFIRDAGDARREHRRKDRAETRFRTILSEKLSALVMERVFQGQELEQLLDRIADRTTDPYTAVGQVLARVEVK